MTDEYLARVFHRETGTLRRLLGDTYEPRLQQGQMALAVDTAIREDSGLVVESPCGTGKSMAYLVPAAYHALSGRGKALVATAHIALQEQLITKDLPLVRSALAGVGDLVYALMKGKNNYLCPLQVNQMRKVSLSFEFGDREAEEAQAILDWSASTQTGDKSELPFTPRGSVWAKFGVGSEECLGKRCKVAQDGKCYLHMARAEAAKAHVVVTNHHMLISDVESGGQVLPKYEHLIVDEGHELAHVAREVLGYSLTAGRVIRLCHWLDKLAKKQQERLLKDSAEAFFRSVERYAKSDKYSVRLRAKPPVQPGPFLSALDGADAAAGSAWETTTDPTALLAQALAQGLKHEVESFVSYEEPERYVYWIQEHGERSVSLECRVLDPAPVLRSGLFDPAEAYVVTSATLSTAGDFSFVRRATGIPATARSLALSTPFDFQRRARFVVPDSVPPSDRDFPRFVAEELLSLIRVAPGGVLGLFTSWRNMEAVVSIIRSRMPSDARLLVQGEAPRTQLVEEFRAVRRSVLCGVASFWQGVDVPGESLVAVLMDKLPFPSPGEPLVDAIHENLGRSSFMEYDLPVACIRVQQGAGRLIRSATDYGAIVLMDPRVFTKGYGRKVLQSLPPMQILRSSENLKAFFEDMSNAK